MRKKYFILVFCFFVIGIEQIIADDITVSIEIRGATINGGIVHGAIYSNSDGYRRLAHDFYFQGNPLNDVLVINMQMPAGEYVVSVYQDTNNNGKLDFGLFGIPKEPVGITNYNGRGIPGNFDRLKVRVNNGSIINVQINH